MIVIRSNGSKVELPDFLLDKVKETNSSDLVLVPADFYRIVTALPDCNTILKVLNRNYVVIYSIGQEVQQNIYKRESNSKDFDNFKIQMYLW